MKFSAILLGMLAAVSNNAFAFDTEQQDLSYSVGISVAHLMPQEARALINVSSFVQGFRDSAAKSTLEYTQNQFNALLAAIPSGSDKVQLRSVMAANKDLYGYWLGMNIANAMIISKKDYDFGMVAQGMLDELTGSKQQITTQRLEQVLGEAAQKENQTLGAQK
jgi:hypothetical protein